jgi:hypothetical protein
VIKKELNPSGTVKTPEEIERDRIRFFLFFF